jgi:hypothetical protein
MVISKSGGTRRTESYRGFLISWEDPPLTGAKWTASIATESANLLNLMGGNGAKVIDGLNANNMLAKARDCIDGLLGVKTTLRDLFVQAISKKAQDVPWHEIREHLINRAHDIGYTRIEEVGAGKKYELVFNDGQKISFDGQDFHFTRS